MGTTGIITSEGRSESDSLSNNHLKIFMNDPIYRDCGQLLSAIVKNRRTGHAERVMLTPLRINSRDERFDSEKLKTIHTIYFYTVRSPCHKCACDIWDFVQASANCAFFVLGYRCPYGGNGEDIMTEMTQKLKQLQWKIASFKDDPSAIFICTKNCSDPEEFHRENFERLIQSCYTAFDRQNPYADASPHVQTCSQFSVALLRNKLQMNGKAFTTLIDEITSGRTSEGEYIAAHGSEGRSEDVKRLPK